MAVNWLTFDMNGMGCDQSNGVSLKLLNSQDVKHDSFEMQMQILKMHICPTSFLSKLMTD